MERETTGIGNAPYKDNPPPEGKCHDCDNPHEHCSCNCPCGFQAKNECDSATCDGICAGERRECGGINPHPTGEKGEWFCERCAEAFCLKPDDGSRANLICELAGTHNARNIAESAKNIADNFAKFAEGFDGGMSDLREAKTTAQAIAAMRRIRKAEESGAAASKEMSSLGLLYRLNDMDIDDFVEDFAVHAFQTHPSRDLGVPIPGVRQCERCPNKAMGGGRLCAVCDFKEETNND